MLGDAYVVRDLNSGEYPEIEETGTTFLANAKLKADGISAVVDGLVISDDSGLEVDALGGQPGVYSSRYAGRDGDHEANNAKLMEEMTMLDAGTLRTARFRCVMAISKHGQTLASFDGAVEGTITSVMAGEKGFGYDPLFVPEGYSQSFAELGSEVKNAMSHRGRALIKVVEWLNAQA